MEGEILRCEDLARLLGCTPKAVRYRVKIGQLPPPFKLGRALAWLRDPVLKWLRDCGRSAGPATMKINLRPYAHDRARWHVDIRIMHPSTNTEIRRRLVAPAGLSEAQARAWGEGQVPRLLREVFDADDDGATPKEVKNASENPTNNKKKSTKSRDAATARATATTIASGSAGATRSAAARPVRRRVPEAPAPPPAPQPPPLYLVPPLSPRASMTLRALYEERFEPEYVRIQKAATQVHYESIFRVHIGPKLGSLPLAAIDEDVISSFRAELRRDHEASTCNVILAKLTKMLRFARRIRIIAAVPEVEKFATRRTGPKAVLSDPEIVRLLEAAAELGEQSELIVLLALDGGLRCSEICGLEWGDIDFVEGSMTIRHSVYLGVRQTPKGTIGKVALTAALRQALERHRRREPIGPLVLYRASHWTGGEWAPYTAKTVSYCLNEAQRRAGLPVSGPHLLRHTALTRLAKLGASVYVVQAVARHSRLQTTQAYLHTQQAGLAREAAELLDRAAAARGPGKNLAKRAKNRGT